MRQETINRYRRMADTSESANVLARTLEISLDEIERLQWMIQYALDGPEDWHALKSILFDTLNGCTGAGNVDEIRAKYGTYTVGEPAAQEGKG